MSITGLAPRHPAPAGHAFTSRFSLFRIWAILGNEMVPPSRRAPCQAENLPVLIRRHYVACCLISPAFLLLCFEGAEELRDAPSGGLLLFGCHIERFWPGPLAMCNKSGGRVACDLKRGFVQGRLSRTLVKKLNMRRAGW
jgi:hypothetical protein